MITKSQEEIEDLLDALKEKILSVIFKVRIGEIVAFDPANQKASIKLVVKPFNELQNKKIVELEPIILNEVPLASFVGNYGSITIPIEVGNYVCVLFTDRNSIDWFLTGEIRKASDTKMHDMNSCFFIPIAPLPNNKLLNDYDNNSIRVKKTDTGEIKIGSGKIEIKNNSGGKVELDDKVLIANNSKNLKTIITTFADSLKQAKVLNLLSGNFDLPLDPATISAIDTFKSDISSLLK